MSGANRHSMLRKLTTPDVIDEIRKEVPMGRLGDPMEIASVALCLVSDDAAYVTGAVWVVDGGEDLT